MGVSIFAFYSIVQYERKKGNLWGHTWSCFMINCNGKVTGIFILGSISPMIPLKLSESTSYQTRNTQSGRYDSIISTTLEYKKKQFEPTKMPLPKAKLAAKNGQVVSINKQDRLYTGFMTAARLMLYAAYWNNAKNK